MEGHWLIHQDMIAWIQNISMNKSKPLSNKCNLSQLSGFLKNLIDQRQDYRTELKMNNAATSSVEELQVLKWSPILYLLSEWILAAVKIMKQSGFIVMVFRAAVNMG